MQLKPSTVASYRLKIDSYLKPTLGKMPVQKLSPTKLSKVFKGLAEHGGKDGNPLSARSVQYARAILRKAMNDAVVARIITVNPCTGSKTPFVPKPPQVTWDTAQQRTFLDAAKVGRWWPLWVIALGTGMRRGEMIALDWDHVDLAKATVSVQRSALEIGKDLVTSDTKTHESRTVALDATTAAVLRAWRSRQVTERLEAGTAWQDTGGHVFTWPDGTRLLPDYATHAFIAAQKGLGLPRMTLHGCRHTHATTLLRAGIPVHVVSKRLGHRNASVTLNVYADAVPHDDDKAVQAYTDAVWGVE